MVAGSKASQPKTRAAYRADTTRALILSGANAGLPEDASGRIFKIERSFILGAANAVHKATEVIVTNAAFHQSRPGSLPGSINSLAVVTGAAAALSAGFRRVKIPCHHISKRLRRRNLLQHGRYLEKSAEIEPKLVAKIALDKAAFERASEELEQYQADVVAVYKDGGKPLPEDVSFQLETLSANLLKAEQNLKRRQTKLASIPKLIRARKADLERQFDTVNSLVVNAFGEQKADDGSVLPLTLEIDEEEAADAWTDEKRLIEARAKAKHSRTAVETLEYANVRKQFLDLFGKKSIVGLSEEQVREAVASGEQPYRGPPKRLSEEERKARAEVARAAEEAASF